MNVLMTVRQLVTSLDRDGIESFVLSFRHAVIQQAQRHGRSVDDYLDDHDIRGTYRKVTNYHNLIIEAEDGTCEVDPAGVDLLLLCLRRLNVPIDQLISNDFRSHPWDQFCAGETLVTVLAQKQVTEQCYISVRDTVAKNKFIDFVRDEQRLSFRPDEKCVSIDDPAADPDGAFAKLQSRRDVGMIVVFGSPAVNPLAEPMARAILQNAGLSRSPAWFEWSCQPKSLGNRSLRHSTLMRRGKVGGVRLAHPVTTKDGAEKLFFPRIGWEAAQERSRNGDEGPFEDCGLMFLDTSCLPMLCLIAGHGGCGTLAALEALLDDENISQELAASYKGGSVLGPGRLLQIVEVNCTKRTPRIDLDDLEFKAGDWSAYTLPSPSPAVV